MHELAHVIIGHEPARVDVTEDGSLILDTYNRDQEDEANWLAGCLLLPRDALLLIKREALELREAAKQYGVSVAMLQYRFNVSGVEQQLKRTRAWATKRK
jgi:Zn-dependent peptidase ImmA (M78 family)